MGLVLQARSVLKYFCCSSLWTLFVALHSSCEFFDKAWYNIKVTCLLVVKNYPWTSSDIYRNRFKNSVTYFLVSAFLISTMNPLRVCVCRLSINLIWGSIASNLFIELLFFYGSSAKIWNIS